MDLDEAQLIFAQWLMFYISLDEMSSKDRPSSKIVSDDKLLDNWLKERQTNDALATSSGGSNNKVGAQGSGKWGKGSVTMGE
jgi:hypothetical protein